jgi:hypothetical protein
VRAALLAIAAVFLAAAPASAQVKQFRDWIAVCDNTRSCTALAVREQATGAWLRFERDGAGDAKPRFTILVEIEKGKKVEFAFDQPGLGGLPKTLAAPDVEGELARVQIGLDTTPAFIASLRKAAKIIVTNPDATKPEDKLTGEISLSGAAAALLWIDEQQKRLGTVTALARPGEKPASGVPSPPAPPQVTPVKADGAPLPKTYPAAILAKGKSICGADGPRPESGEPNRLNGNLVLYWFNCRAMSGAYNSWSGLLIAPRDKPEAARVVQLPYPPGEVAISGIAKHLVVNGGFDEKTMSLTMFGKSRGPGDCGTSGEWVWDGKDFRLTRYQSMLTCGGLMSDYWPTLYRANVKKP